MRGLSSVQQRIGRLLEWSIVDRCILVAVIALPLATWYLMVEQFVLSHPETFPWIDLAFGELVAKVQLGFVASWVALILIGVALRSRRPDSHWLVYVTIELYFVCTLIVSSFLGVHTNNLIPIILLAGVAVLSMLFDRRPVLLGMSFSEVADNIEPEELSRILNEYLSEMTEIAERYEATVDKFVGRRDDDFLRRADGNT